MNQEITTELLEIIYNRATEFATAKYGSTPDSIRLEEGSLTAVWYGYERGDEDTEYIYAENLTEDLEEVAKQRAIKKEEDRKKQIAHEANLKKIREEDEKRKEFNQYLVLKKKYETK